MIPLKMGPCKGDQERNTERSWNVHGISRHLYLNGNAKVELIQSQHPLGFGLNKSKDFRRPSGNSLVG